MRVVNDSEGNPLAVGDEGNGRGLVIWLTGLSGAGKSTIAQALIAQLRARGRRNVELLDGDAVRTNLSKGLGFSKEDRDTNIMRIGFVCELLSRNGVIAIAAAISPYREVRDRLRLRIPDFVEVHVSAPIATLVDRDVKGLYKKALAGEIDHFTGISDPYEEPLAAEVVLQTGGETVERSVGKLLRALELLGYIPARASAISAEEEDRVVEQLRLSGRAQETIALPHPAPPENHAKSPSGLIPAHGGELITRVLGGRERDSAIDDLERYPSLEISPRQWADLELIATGAYSPLRGFMNEREYRSVITDGRLANGLAWTIPILLLVDGDAAAEAKQSERVVLRDRDGRNLAFLHVEDMYRIDREVLAQKVWGTTDANHPGVALLQEEGTIALAGPIEAIRLETSSLFPGYRQTPAETREVFRDRGWRTVAAFQTRNPVHRAHEYIQKVALELVDGLLLHPLVGYTKKDDVPAEVRMECYDVLLNNYYPKERVLLSVLPAAMRYAGPKEAIHHAIIRQNYGCTHFIVGRDHAGVGSYYGTYDAQRIFDEYTREELAITPLRFENSFHCTKCESMASEKTCPHGPEHRVLLSGTAVRERLRSRAEIPREFSRPEVVRVLQHHYAMEQSPEAA